MTESVNATDTVPSNVDAERRVGLLTTSLVDTLGSFHHIFHRLVVAEFKFMDHLLTILDYANLTNNNNLQHTVADKTIQHNFSKCSF